MPGGRNPGAGDGNKAALHGWVVGPQGRLRTCTELRWGLGEPGQRRKSREG